MMNIVAAMSLMLGGSALAEEMPALAKKNGCDDCHAIDKKIIGPAWMDVSKFYNGKLEKTTAGKTVKEATGGKATEEFLLTKISKGGAGNWGSIPMRVNDPSGKKEADIKELIKFVLGLAK